ncbi:Di-copper centre-containing protein [Pluteus cervinus]|uniref:Di-copper centre-containing protein n=1 Tax=Pluteus cervinus TaxID=181527 RepID=A0ACD3ALF2_9AGAR|nr:Di-copper centre-containing protein [Pluteus cervinus]
MWKFSTKRHSTLLLLPVLLSCLSVSCLDVVEAPCTNPAIRKEWRALSDAQKAQWIDAVKCLANLPHDPALVPTINPRDIPPVNTSSSYYDDFVYVHMDLNTIIHSTGLFLPWHRHYVHSYEVALREKCGYSGASPYWDWTQDSHDVEAATIFDSDPTTGLGLWGDRGQDYQVTTGGFSSSSTFKLSYPSPHPLRRNFTLQPFLGFPPVLGDVTVTANSTFTKEKIDGLVNGHVGDFKRFQMEFEWFMGSHSAVHLMFAGDMGGTCPGDAPSGCVGGPTFSANEPMFWLHHAMVDKVWYDWQLKSPANAVAFEGGSAPHLDHYDIYPTGGPPWLTLDSPMRGDGLFAEATIGQVLNTTAGTLCYVYA